MYRVPCIALLFAGCGHTPEYDSGGAKYASADTAAVVGDVPTLAQVRFEYEPVDGVEMLVLKATLADADDDLVPGGTMWSKLYDADGRERTLLEGLKLGSDAARLPVPTELVVPFPIARDSTVGWSAKLRVADRAGNRSEMSEAEWVVDDDSGL